MCHKIEQKFQTKEMFFWSATLSPADLQNAIIMLTDSSIKHWREVDFSGCYIQDYGIQTLHRGLQNSKVTIKNFWLNYNNLSSASDSSLYGIIYSCRVKFLSIGNNNTVGETEKFTTTLLSDPLNELERLSMSGNKYSSTKWAVQLFTFLMDNKSLKVLELANTNITDDMCGTIIGTLQVNSTLQELNLSCNPITGKASQLIIDSLKDNQALQLLTIPNYSECTNNNIYALQEVVNKNRSSRQCEANLKILMKMCE